MGGRNAARPPAGYNVDMPVLECPICHKTVAYGDVEEAPFRPFCSRRCKLVDLGRWLNEEYRISEELADPVRPGVERPPDGEGE